jgi:hypothetical protein
MLLLMSRFPQIVLILQFGCLIAVNVFQIARGMSVRVGPFKSSL